MNIREIAKLANVSIATVSRVVNRPEVVLPETREQVLAVMRQYDYSPAPPRGSRSGRASTVLLLVPDGGSYLNQRLMAGIENVAGAKEYMVSLCSTHNDAAQLQRLVRAGAEQRYAGIVIAGDDTGEDDAAPLAEAQLPFVLVGNSPAAASCNACYINTEEGAYRMARHLLKMGHHGVTLLCGGNEQRLEAAMRAGLDRAFYESEGRRAWPRRILRVEDSVRGGYLAAGGLVEEGLPDALFATSDEVALGLIGGLRERGIEVPGDVAVAGFSDAPVSSVSAPALTTMEQPTYKLGMVAARMLFDLIDAVVPDTVPQEIVLLPKLKIRTSCGNRKPISTVFE